MLRLKQRKAFLESRIVENKAWAANYDEHFGPFVNKYKEFMEQVSGPKVGRTLLCSRGAVLATLFFPANPALQCAA